METDLEEFRLKTDANSRAIQQLRHNLEYKDKQLNEAKTKITEMLKDLNGTILTPHLENNEDDYGLKRGQFGSSTLSPFEKRLANYQKSAEMRKTENTGFRSASNRRYPQTAHGTNDNPEFVHASQALRKLNSVWDMFSQQYDLKQNDVSQLVVQAERNVAQQMAFIAEAESGESKPRKNPLSPKNLTNYRNMSSLGSDEKKIGELQRNNDNLFIELRKANEKYLNQRVENNRLKDEIQLLQSSLDNANTQIKKSMASNTSLSSSKGEIRKKHRTQRDQS